jgi:hypothetical protein
MRALFGVLLEQEGGDQEAGEDEEETEPGAAAVERPLEIVAADDERDSDAAQPVEGRDVTEPSRPRCRILILCEKLSAFLA